MSETICGKCGLPIHDSESGVRHFGTSQAHSENRCVELLKSRVSELTRDRDDCLAARTHYAEKVGELSGRIHQLEARGAAVTDGWKLVLVERNYDQRVKALIAFNQAEHSGKDRDDALQAAWVAMLQDSPSHPTIKESLTVESRSEVDGMSRNSRAMLLNVLWHHQGGSSPIGQPLRKLFGLGQHDRMTDDQIEEAKRIAAIFSKFSDFADWSNRHTDTLDGWVNELLTLSESSKDIPSFARQAMRTIAVGIRGAAATCDVTLMVHADGRQEVRCSSKQMMDSRAEIESRALEEALEQIKPSMTLMEIAESIRQIAAEKMAKGGVLNDG